MSIINALPFNLQNGTTADATQVMANFDEILNDVNNNAAKNGVNSDITALTALTTPIAPSAGGSTIFYGAGSGTANAQIVASTTPTGFALTAGFSVYWIPSVANTGALTLAVNGTTATAVKFLSESGLEALIGGEVVINQLAKATYDGTQFVLDLDPMVGFGAFTSLASATTTDLGTALSHSIAISGTTTITSFGATANAARPVYLLYFQGAMILTNSSPALILPGNANITTAASDSALVVYTGSGNWQMLAYFRRSGAPFSFTSVPSAIGLSILNNTGTPNSQIDIAADQVIMTQLSSATAILATAVALTVNTSTTGANGLDTGSRAATTVYNLFLISNGSTTSGLASLSATAPTLPSGYIYFMRVGAMITDGSGNFLRTRQVGNHTQNLTSAANLPQISTGNLAVTSKAIGAFVPPTAVSIYISYFGQTNGVGPSYLGAAGASFGALPNTQPFAEMEDGTNGSQVDFYVKTQEIVLQSTNIFVASTGMTSAIFQAAGWRDKVLAA